ncbi:ABC-three component system middle component 6 [Methanobrevibacter sp. DSM 116169]|uniref:ABC-three component system middle component 6 n=1 Tax=Methanobrevibacter sp. DSM 116169 TaxID=3242727 RepID=UPI0038FC69F4
MILPTKYLNSDETLIGVGNLIIRNISSSIPLSTLWEKVKKNENVYNFERFLLTLDMLFIIGIIDLDNENNIIKVKQ